MTEYTSLHLPGSDSALASDDFDPGEIAGMRTAGWILVAGAVIGTAGMLLSRNPGALLGIGVDAILGFKLLRLRHSWRAWTMLRAFVGIALALFLLMSVSLANGFGAIVFSIGQIGYFVALILLLYSRPSLQRVKAGRNTFFAATALVIAGVAMASSRAESLRQPAPEPAGVTAIVDGTSVLLTGQTGDRLAAAELSRVHALVRSSGRPWVVVGLWPEASSPTSWPIAVFLEPESTSERIRRGDVVLLTGTLSSDSTPDRYTVESWDVVPLSLKYAHVTWDPAPSSTPDSPAWNRPFIVQPAASLPNLTDNEIVSVTDVLRTDPDAHLAGVNGTWPIENMTRMGGGAVAVILADPGASRRQGQRVTLVQGDEGWMVSDVSPWAI